jgi:hypothetical protein
MSLFFIEWDWEVNREVKYQLINFSNVTLMSFNKSTDLHGKLSNQLRGGPLKVVGKARHMISFEPLGRTCGPYRSLYGLEGPYCCRGTPLVAS